MKYYRPDIDGLRALAVLPVLLFHAGVPGFSGGFVGVDVFFVISGYLITSILVRDIDQHRFSLLKFYQRRFQRLLPALFVVLGAVLIASWSILSPAQMRVLGSQLISTSVFASNFYFFRSGDYFGPNADDLHLLHTWSLAIEEQFYFVFPLVLMAVGARSKWRVPILGALLVASFALSCWGVMSFPSATFYMLPTRAWEMLVGSMLALHVVPIVRKRWAVETLATLGLVAVILPVVIFNGATAFPGLAAAMPVLGSAALIHAGTMNTSWVSKGLSHFLPVWIGKISYSLYLWHWPALLLAHSYVDLGLEPSVGSRVLALVFSFVAAWATWKWVETPCRQPSTSRATVYTMAFGASAATIVIGLGLRALDGMPERWSPESQALFAASDDRPPLTCIRGSRSPEDLDCLVGRPDQTPRVAIWGDSHAHALLPMFEVFAYQHGWTATTHLRSACPPLLGTWMEGRSDCPRYNIETAEYLLEEEGVDTVILAGRWALTAEAYRPRNPEVRLRIHDEVNSGSSREAFRTGLHATVNLLLDAGKQVVLVKSTPEFYFDVPTVAALHHERERLPPAMELEAVNDRNHYVDMVFAELAAHPRIRVADVRTALCDGGTCALGYKQELFYSDSHHLTTAAAARLAEKQELSAIFSIP